MNFKYNTDNQSANRKAIDICYGNRTVIIYVKWTSSIISSELGILKEIHIGLLKSANMEQGNQISHRISMVL